MYFGMPFFYELLILFLLAYQIKKGEKGQGSVMQWMDCRSGLHNSTFETKDLIVFAPKIDDCEGR